VHRHPAHVPDLLSDLASAAHTHPSWDLAPVAQCDYASAGGRHWKCGGRHRGTAVLSYRSLVPAPEHDADLPARVSLPLASGSVVGIEPAVDLAGVGSRTGTGGDRRAAVDALCAEDPAARP